MKPLIPRQLGLLLIPVCLFCCALPGVADQVEMQNGDRYTGRVLSLDEKSLVLQNEVLGKLTLPRAKVAVVLLGEVAVKPVTNSVPQKIRAPAATNSLMADFAAHSNIISQVQRQFLAGAEPEAQDKFNTLVTGLLNGSITVEDVQREARTAADQIRALKKDLGSDSGFALDAYLAILDRFLKEAPPEPGATNSPAPAHKD